MGPVVVGDVQHEGWVVPVFADGAEGAGTWQDDTVLRDDGGVHTHTRGQVQREVLEEAEEWRPDAAIVGCACGWRGRPWTRVLTEDQADVGARLLHNPGPYGDLDARRRRWSWRSGAGTSPRGGR